jgi:hypothetical protein
MYSPKTKVAVDGSGPRKEILAPQRRIAIRATGQAPVKVKRAGLPDQRSAGQNDVFDAHARTRDAGKRDLHQVVISGCGRVDRALAKPAASGNLLTSPT